jgi:hypothetical protein
MSRAPYKTVKTGRRANGQCGDVQMIPPTTERRSPALAERNICSAGQYIFSWSIYFQLVSQVVMMQCCRQSRRHIIEFISV